jgi:hypothetical protein
MAKIFDASTPPSPEQHEILKQWLESPDVDLYQYLLKSATLSDDGKKIEVVYVDGEDKTVSFPAGDGAAAFEEV